MQCTNTMQEHQHIGRISLDLKSSTFSTECTNFSHWLCHAMLYYAIFPFHITEFRILSSFLHSYKLFIGKREIGNGKSVRIGETHEKLVTVLLIRSNSWIVNLNTQLCTLKLHLFQWDRLIYARSWHIGFICSGIWKQVRHYAFA